MLMAIPCTAREVLAGELRSLVGIEDLGPAVL